MPHPKGSYFASTRENLRIKPIVESVEEVKNQLHPMTTNIGIFDGIRDQITSLTTEMASRTASNVVAIETTRTTESRTLKKKDNYDALRVRGIKESKAKSSRQRYEHDLKEVKTFWISYTSTTRSKT